MMRLPLASMMRLPFGLSVSVALLTALGALADERIGLERVTFPEFPYCPCTKGPSPYSLVLLPSPPSNTHCFRIGVNEPENCDAYCCKEADVMKLEMDVNPACKVTGQILSATVNGKPAATVPTIEKSVDKSTNSYILKLTRLGLDRTTANGTDICITLGENKPGACTTLEQLCVPPAGSPPGVCNTALFDANVRCCAMPDNGGITPGFLNPPSPERLPVPCTSCVYLKNRPSAAPGNQPPSSFSQEMCTEFAALVVDRLESLATDFNAVISTPFALTECAPQQIKVCGEFASDDEGAKLQPVADQIVGEWLSMIAPNYHPTVAIGGDGPDGAMPPEGCLNAIATIVCEPSTPAFPTCKCAKAADSMPFTVDRAMTAMPGRNENVTCYCIDIRALGNPSNGPMACRQADVLNKVEFLARESLRRKLTGVGLQPAGAPAMKFVQPSWGPYGENTAKVTQLNWNSTLADGAKICLEISNTIALGDFCMGGCSSLCWLSLFDASRSCCPVYNAIAP